MARYFTRRCASFAMLRCYVDLRDACFMMRRYARYAIHDDSDKDAYFISMPRYRCFAARRDMP